MQHSGKREGPVLLLSRRQYSLKSFLYLLRGFARFLNISLIGDFGAGGGGGGGSVMRRSSIMIEKAILRCANSSMRKAIPVRNREARWRGAAICLVMKRLGFDCMKREPLTV